MGKIFISGSNNTFNTVHVPHRAKKKVDLPAARKVKNVVTISAAPQTSEKPINVTPAPVVEAPVAEAPAIPVAPKQLSTQEKIKNFASYFIIAVGIALVLFAGGALVSHAFGGIQLEPAAIQAIFMSGLGAVVGGISLQNGDYKGNLTLGGGSLPFSLNFQQK